MVLVPSTLDVICLYTFTLTHNTKRENYSNITHNLTIIIYTSPIWEQVQIITKDVLLSDIYNCRGCILTWYVLSCLLRTSFLKSETIYIL